jgi:Mlc titration factor MtfA (ptsG expression regulator)
VPIELLVPLVTVAVVALLLWWPRRRLRRALAQPFPAPWREIVLRRLPVFAALAEVEQEQLLRLVQQFLLEKQFFGCGGQLLDDEVRLTIAANACLLLLNRPVPLFPGLRYVLVYPAEFVVPLAGVDEMGIAIEGQEERAGESWGQGKVILSWRDVAWDARHWNDGQNVVLHEFAHQLDQLSGTEGAPWRADPELNRHWRELWRREFELHCAANERGARSFLDPYGCTGPHEFFAVSTEAFFEQPHRFSALHGELFEALKDYYAVDPRLWQLDAPERAVMVRGWPRACRGRADG